MKNGGYLFPQDEVSSESSTGFFRHGGATMRDFFAAAALASGYVDIKECFQIADEILAYREKQIEKNV